VIFDIEKDLEITSVEIELGALGVVNLMTLHDITELQTLANLRREGWK
jgi:hypothetical protein